MRSSPLNYAGWSVIVLLLLAASCSVTRENDVAAFLAGAERQSESEDQKGEIRRALQDVLKLPPAELRGRRYADYQMRTNAWTVVELLQRYYVPRSRAFLDPETFYDQLRDRRVRTAVERHLMDLETE